MSAADPALDQTRRSPRSLLIAELPPGEKLLWAGAPTPGRAAAASAGPAVIGAIFVLFALGNVFQAAVARPDPARKRTPAWAIALMGLAGSALGLVPARAYRRAGRTAYALTDRRALLLEPRLGGGFAIRSYGPDRLGSLARRDSPFGGPAGDLTFEDNSRTIFRKRPITRRGFLQIEDAVAVEALIRATLLDDRRRP